MKAGSPRVPGMMKTIPYTLFESQAATVFEDAHLLGNGSLGAAVYGGVPYERIELNHDTLWSGQERLKVHPGTRQNLGKARELIRNGRLKEANNLINDEMMGFWSECYQPLGTLHLTLGQTDDWRSMKLQKTLSRTATERYRRALSLNEAVETVAYEQDGVRYTREYFASFPDQVLVLRLTATGGPLTFLLAMESPLRHETRVLADGLSLTGRAPDRADSYILTTQPALSYLEEGQSDSLRFAAHVHVVETDGRIVPDPFRLGVVDASYAVMVLAAGTNYAGYKAPRDRDVRQVLARCQAVAGQAAAKGYAALKRDHIADYGALFNRVAVEIGEPVTDALPTSARLAALAGPIDDPSLAGLVLQYVRYLTIAGSRPGSQAMNLQGIWNSEPTPPWCSNYTTNINVEMNYWAAEVLNLSECHQPLIDLVRELADSGQTAARELYGARGWVTHHNTDLWRMATLAGEDAAWSWWPFGGIWLCHHLWEHYLYSRDEAFLRDTVYPVFKGAAQFLLDFLTEDGRGHRVTSPSTSPENKFLLPDFSFKKELAQVEAGNRFSPNDKQVCAVCKASTMDLAMTRELFGNFLEAVEKLGIEDAIVPNIHAALEKLYPFKIGKHGQLQEWDEDYEECTPGMGHLSHLYPVFPAAVITASRSPDLFAAAEQAFLRRKVHGGLTAGWPGVWAMALAARFKNAFLCAETHKSLARNAGANLFVKGNRKQIDCLLGWGGALAEMLLQSHDGCVELLPALPPLWRTGAIRGLRGRGGLTVDMAWDKRALTGATLTASKGGTFQIRYGHRAVSIEMKAGQVVRLDGNLNVAESL